MYPWRIECVSSEHHCQAEVFCSWYMQIVEPLHWLQSLQARPTWLSWLSWSSLMSTPPPFPWGDKVIDHDTNIYIEWHNIIHGNRKERLRGIGSGPGPSSPPSCFLGMVIKTQYPYPRIKLAYQYSTDSWPISMHTDHNFCAAVFLWKLGATQ